MSLSGLKMLMDDTEAAKRIKLLDLMMRGAANGTMREVAAAIAKDWNPPTEIKPDGSLVIVMMDGSEARAEAIATFGRA